MSDYFNSERFKRDERKFQLHNFLKIPAPDEVYEDQKWLNEDGESIIDGFWTLDPEPVRYEDEAGEYYINSRGERFNVVRKEPVIREHRKRLVKTEDDFKELYDKYFSAEPGLVDNYHDNHLFKTEKLIPQIEDLIHLHKDAAGPSGIDLSIIKLAKEFIHWLIPEKEPFEIPNPYPKHFKSTKAYQVFLLFHNDHKSIIKKRDANYSRFGWLMYNDKSQLKVCNNEYVHFISNKEFDVNIDRHRNESREIIKPGYFFKNIDLKFVKKYIDYKIVVGLNEGILEMPKT
tara:strand:- start:14872 stop:15735 length:864 start_codon:yes stop_codon:yes gene_type:complete